VLGIQETPAQPGLPEKKLDGETSASSHRSSEAN